MRAEREDGVIRADDPSSYRDRNSFGNVRKGANWTEQQRQLQRRGAQWHGLRSPRHPQPPASDATNALAHRILRLTFHVPSSCPKSSDLSSGEQPVEWRRSHAAAASRCGWSATDATAPRNARSPTSAAAISAATGIELGLVGEQFPAADAAAGSTAESECQQHGHAPSSAAGSHGRRLPNAATYARRLQNGRPWAESRWSRLSAAAATAISTRQLSATSSVSAWRLCHRTSAAAHEPGRSWWGQQHAVGYPGRRLPRSTHAQPQWAVSAVPMGSALTPATCARRSSRKCTNG